MCAAPRAPPGEKFNLALALALEVSANGGADWSASGVPFAYRTVPRVIDAAPLWGGTPGGTRITVLLMASVQAVGPVAGGPPGGGTVVTVRGAGFVRRRARGGRRCDRRVRDAARRLGLVCGVVDGRPLGGRAMSGRRACRFGSVDAPARLVSDTSGFTSNTSGAC